MPRSLSIPESKFLSVITCPKYLDLNYNPYKLDLTQSIALNSLKLFYKNISKLNEGLDLDNLLNLVVVKSIGSKLKNELDATKKSIKLYSYTFVYDFIKRFPLETWTPLLVDLKVPYETIKYNILLNYDFVLKSKESKEIFVVTFMHKLDRQIEGNLHYFECKASHLHDKIYEALNKPKINHLLFYLPRYKHAAVKQRDTFAYIPITPKSDLNIKVYVDIFLNKIQLKRNPFCLNYSCKVRKYCYDSK